MSSCQAGGIDVNPAAAIDYVQAVKAQVSPDVFNQFVAVLQDFRRGDVDVVINMKRTAKLFDGYPALIQGCSPFMPEGHRFEINFVGDKEYTVVLKTPTSSETIGNPERFKIINANLPTVVKDENSPFEKMKEEDMALAKEYVEKVSARFAGNMSILQKFWGILGKYNKDVPDSGKTIQAEVEQLFQGEQDLIEGFDGFWKLVSTEKC